MEKKMFVMEEVTNDVWMTSLNRMQFQYLQEILNIYPTVNRGIWLEEHKTSIEDAIEPTIKVIRANIEEGISDFKEGYREPFDISDEVLTELILRFGKLERFAEVSGTVTRNWSELFPVPLDEDLYALYEKECDEFDGFHEDFISDDGVPEEYDGQTTDVLTRMSFKIPSPAALSANSSDIEGAINHYMENN